MNKDKIKNVVTKSLVLLLLTFCITVTGCTVETGSGSSAGGSEQKAGLSEVKSVTLDEIPAYSGDAYVQINNNIPDFGEDENTREAFEQYSNLDSLGRCGVAFANIGQEIMPTEKRGSIGMVKPSGWHTVKYDVVDGKYLYNRCHLIGYQLAGENANTKNLITGTRYMNTEGMLPFEDMVADYVKDTGNHVLYRVTPIFQKSNPVASGVTMEARSVEDQGEGIQFYVYAYNVQPGVSIDYTDGKSKLSSAKVAKVSDNKKADFILNSNTNKYHKPSCSSVETMKGSNKKSFSGSESELEKMGYQPCKNCN